MSGGNWKAMFKAIQENDLELVKFYLKSHIDPNYQHPEFMALPLAESIRYSNLKITKLLLLNGANPLIKEIESNLTPLELAKEMKNQKAIDLLTLFNQSI
ncbi:ankyrin repeat domain-containing protein [Aquimarina agarivorans]|uniref:ankyrin repeat domain-containing protein n=1 Tax=Aquimarina agarivorans TaxID=980584 RepID=UPI000248E828|nr:ankyrin repeat domain-containing protein [Aquimarina agarivorans]